MSYNMDFETDDNIRPDDAVMSYEGGFRLVCDPKSLLYLFGELPHGPCQRDLILPPARRT
jgi:hypothetical protein